jgi:hypothetical protein
MSERLFIRSNDSTRVIRHRSMDHLSLENDRQCERKRREIDSGKSEEKKKKERNEMTMPCINIARQQEQTHLLFIRQGQVTMSSVYQLNAQLDAGNSHYHVKLTLFSAK